MSLKYERLTFTAFEGVAEAIQKHFEIKFPFKRHNVAEVLTDKARKKEHLIELNKFQGNIGLMGTAISLIGVKEGAKQVYRIFFNCHIYVKEDEIIPLLLQMYQSELQAFFNASDLMDEKTLKDAVKALGKNDPRMRLGLFLLKLQPFPAENIAEITRDEFALANKLFHELLSSEGNVFQCPYDGERMSQMYEDKYGIKFCSEDCKRRYYFLLYNTTKRGYVIPLNGVAKDQSSYGSFLQARTSELDCNPIKQPNICLLCGNVHNFHSSEVNKIDHWYVSTSSGGLPVRGLKTTYTLKVHQQWMVPICDSCRSLFQTLEVSAKGLKCKLKEKEMQGITLQDVTKNIDIRSHMAAIQTTTPNKFLIWHLLSMNPFLSMPSKLTDFLVSLSGIDPESAFDWMEHRCMNGWPALYEEMYKNRIEETEDAMSLFATEE